MEHGGEKCPDCGGGRVWRLGDGRCRCAECKRRFTPRRRSRLSAGRSRRLALCFWQMVPTRQAATAVSLNRKTVQRYYRIWRREIGGGEGPSSNEGRVSGEERAVAALALEEGRVRVLSPETAGASEVALVFLRPGKTGRLRDLSELQLWVGESGAAADSFIRFWALAGRLATMTRGQALQDVPLFLREVAYRVNQGNNPRVIDALCRLVDGSGR